MYMCVWAWNIALHNVQHTYMYWHTCTFMYTYTHHHIISHPVKINVQFFPFILCKERGGEGKRNMWYDTRHRKGGGERGSGGIIATPVDKNFKYASTFAQGSMQVHMSNSNPVLNTCQTGLSNPLLMWLPNTITSYPLHTSVMHMYLWHATVLILWLSYKQSYRYMYVPTHVHTDMHTCLYMYKWSGYYTKIGGESSISLEKNTSRCRR